MKWDDASVPKRVRLARRAGLEGKVGSKSWADLSSSERQAIKEGGRSKESLSPAAVQRIPQKPAAKLGDYLMWVGSLYYTRYTDFVKEARRMGCCKRLSHELTGMEAGKTRVFLAHDEGIVGEGFIFGYFVVNRVEIIVKESGVLPFWVSEKCTPVDVAAVYEEEERGCGYREEDGLYAVSETDRDTLKAVARELGIKRGMVGGGFVPITPAVRYEGTHFRGALAIDGAPLLVPFPGGPPRFEPMSDRYPVRVKQKGVWTEETESLLESTVEEMADTGRPKAQAFARVALMLGIKRSRVISRWVTMTKRGEED